jgi:predicted nucleotidyltransferase
MGNIDSIPEKIKRLFWDVDKDAVNLKLHQSYIIRRIMDYGNIDDVKWMLAAYTTEEIVEVLRKSRALSRKSANFWSAYFNIPKEEIECLKMPCPKSLRPF